MNRYGKVIWAGAVRYQDGKFWIYSGTPDEGFFITTAQYGASKPCMAPYSLSNKRLQIN